MQLPLKLNIPSTVKILIAEDEPADAILMETALKELDFKKNISVVQDGVTLLDYLNQQPPYEKKPLPDIIFLDLNMPRKSGREALAEIKNTPQLRRIPIIILTTSRHERDIIDSYNLHANAYIVKPDSFEALVGTLSQIFYFWFVSAKLPQAA